jgi:hypothetical protein
MSVAFDSLENISLPSEPTRIYVKFERWMLRFFDSDMAQSLETDPYIRVHRAGQTALRNAHKVVSTRLFGPPDLNDSTWRGERTWRKIAVHPDAGRADKYWYGFSYMHNHEYYEFGEEQPLVLELTVDRAVGGRAVFRLEWLEGEARQASNDATNEEITQFWETRD